MQIGDNIVGVRIAIRDMAKQGDSQIYNWGIKKDTTLGGVRDDHTNRKSNDASSDVSFDNSVSYSEVKSNPSDENSSKKSSESGKRASMDSDYMSAVERGDMVTAQRMVDEVAKKNGFNNLFYHGAKKGGGFTIFKDWSYFTENKQYAERYTHRDKK